MKKLFLSMAAVLLSSVAFAQSYTLYFVENTDASKDAGDIYSKGSTPEEYIANIFGGTDKVASIDTRDVIYPARENCGAKFGSSKKAGFIGFTLANPTEVDSIVISAAMYGKEEGKDGFKAINVLTEDTAAFALSAGNKEFEKCVWEPAGEVKSIRINQTTIGQRIYVKSITIHPKKAEPENPTSITPPSEEQGSNRIYTLLGAYVGTNLDILPSGTYILNGKKVIK